MNRDDNVLIMPLCTFHLPRFSLAASNWPSGLFGSESRRPAFAFRPSRHMPRNSICRPVERVREHNPWLSSSRWKLSQGERGKSIYLPGANWPCRVNDLGADFLYL